MSHERKEVWRMLTYAPRQTTFCCGPKSHHLVLLQGRVGAGFINGTWMILGWSTWHGETIWSLATTPIGKSSSRFLELQRRAPDARAALLGAPQKRLHPGSASAVLSHCPRQNLLRSFPFCDLSGFSWSARKLDIPFKTRNKRFACLPFVWTIQLCVYPIVALIRIFSKDENPTAIFVQYKFHSMQVMVSLNLPLLIHPHTLSYSTINSFQSENSDGDSGIRGRAPKRRPSLRTVDVNRAATMAWHVGVVEGSQEDLDIWKLMWLLVEPSQKYIYSLRRIHLWNGKK